MDEYEDRKSPWNYHTCNVCPKKRKYYTKHVSTMLQHLREVHRTPRTDPFCHSDLELHKCSQCEFETCISVSLKNHVDMTHNNLQVDHKLADLLQGYFCKYCELNTFSIFVLAKHDCKKAIADERAATEKHFTVSSEIEEDERKGPWNYPTCNVRPNNRKYYNKKHLACEDCQREFSRTDHLKLHILYNHTPDDKIKWFQCGHCPYKGKVKASLKKHILNKHTLEDKTEWIKCEHCPYKCKVKTSLKKHIINKHTLEDNIKWIKCEHCPYKCKMEALLKRHINDNHALEDKIKWSKCERCPCKFKEKWSLNIHIKNKPTSEDKIEWIKCEHCPYKFKEKWSLNIHIINKHTSEDKIKWIKCEHCPYKCKVKKSLKRHIINKHTLEDKIDNISVLK